MYHQSRLLSEENKGSSPSPLIAYSHHFSPLSLSLFFFPSLSLFFFPSLSLFFFPSLSLFFFPSLSLFFFPSLSLFFFPSLSPVSINLNKKRSCLSIPSRTLKSEREEEGEEERKREIVSNKRPEWQDKWMNLELRGNFFPRTTTNEFERTNIRKEKEKETEREKTKATTNGSRTSSKEKHPISEEKKKLPIRPLVPLALISSRPLSFSLFCFSSILFLFFFCFFSFSMFDSFNFCSLFYSTTDWLAASVFTSSFILTHLERLF